MNPSSIIFIGVVACLLSFCGGVIANATSDDDVRSDNATFALLAAACLGVLLAGYVIALILQ